MHPREVSLLTRIFSLSISLTIPHSHSCGCLGGLFSCQGHVICLICVRDLAIEAWPLIVCQSVARWWGPLDKSSRPEEITSMSLIRSPKLHEIMNRNTLVCIPDADLSFVMTCQYLLKGCELINLPKQQGSDITESRAVWCTQSGWGCQAGGLGTCSYFPETSITDRWWIAGARIKRDVETESRVWLNMKLRGERT